MENLEAAGDYEELEPFLNTFLKEGGLTEMF